MGEGSNNKCSKKVTELYLERLNKVDPDPAKTEMTDPKRRKNEKRLASTKVRLEKLQKKMSGKDKDQEKICKELYKLHKKTNRVFAAEAKADLLSLCGLMAGELGCCGTYDPFRC